MLIVSTTRRKISRITVQLSTRQSLVWPGDDKSKREDDEVSRREVALDEDGGVWLEKGLNTSVAALAGPRGNTARS